MNPEISIIIPIYNPGTRLKDAIKSIIAQKFTDWELICVDDCSDDKDTIEIEKEYCNLNKIRFINNKKRVGAATARNIGFQEAKGKYVIFVDADDVFSEFLLEKPFMVMESEKTDVCIWNIEKINIKTEEEIIIFINKINKNINGWLSNIYIAPWNKMCRREFLIENDIYFQNLTSCNDVFFSCKSIMCTEKISYIDGEPLVKHYIGIPNQISESRDPFNLIRACEKLKMTFENDNNLVTECHILMVLNGILEMQRAKDYKAVEYMYEYLCNYFGQKKIIFKNKKAEIIKNKILESPCDYKWIYELDSYELKLKNFIDIKKLKLYDRIYIWGLGRNGKALEKFLIDNDVKLMGVTDIKNDKIGEITPNGTIILQTNEVLDSGGTILCSNNKIMEYLVEKNISNTLINIADFIP